MVEKEAKTAVRDAEAPAEVKDAAKAAAKAADGKTADKASLDDAGAKMKAAMGEVSIDSTKCKLPGFMKRCETDHNACLDVCDLKENYALYLFVLSIVGVGGISRLCYLCCSKTEQSPTWILKSWIWLNLWIGLFYMIFIGWIWGIIFCW